MFQKITYLIVLLLFCQNILAQQITAKVFIENCSPEGFTEGKLWIKELDTIFVIHKSESKIQLPKEGSYHFRFSVANFYTVLKYPDVFTEEDNQIHIQLHKKQKFDNLLLNNQPTFILHGFDSSIPKEFVDFQEKYGVGVIKKSCPVDPSTLANNKAVAKYLTETYGETWKNDLPFKPMVAP
ncbi:hypothetical protein [Mesonia sp. K7]|uniref:FEKKY domain-containing protein n=1 Tax=Mesonia sp. K7 TaxID=2218606 RepID=UPI000DAA8BB3|nr:hypothetical protein [Mesonia sp. K7]PZD77298.1 hypothetical protein DNG35_09510 [Mesonia sp. K7]